MASIINTVGSGEAPIFIAESVSAADEIADSAVSWPAIIAGAIAAFAATIILLVLGAGIGFSFVSPWYGVGASATTVGVSAVIWLVVVQWLSSGLGGFLAGRLRTKWIRVHIHEVFFRDTVHGFLAWSLASVAGALIFAAVTVSGVAGVAKGASDHASEAASGLLRNSHANDEGSDGLNYFTDTLFRSTNPVEGDVNASRMETLHILTRSTANGQVALSPADSAYLAQIVAARTGLSQADAEQRVGTVVQQLNEAKQSALNAAEAARKRLAQLSIVTALSMLIGAFIASAAAAVGGSIRDE